MPRLSTGWAAMTKAQAEKRIASGFVDPVVIQPLPVWSPETRRTARSEPNRKLVEATKRAASGTSTSSRKSLCRLAFRKRPTAWSRGVGRQSASATACRTLAAGWQSKTPRCNETMRFRAVSACGSLPPAPQNRLKTQLSSPEPIWGAPTCCSILKDPRVRDADACGCGWLRPSSYSGLRRPGPRHGCRTCSTRA